MIKLLDNLITKYADEECIYFSWDAASWHASKELYERVDVVNSHDYRSKTRCPLVRLAPLPTCAQFLNVIQSALVAWPGPSFTTAIISQLMTAGRQ